MNIKRRLAAFCYLINMIAFIFIGLAFVFKQEFFGFHSSVIQTSWQDLDLSSQTLYLGMMRTEGAGFLAAAVAFAFSYTSRFDGTRHGPIGPYRRLVLRSTPPPYSPPIMFLKRHLHLHLG